MPKNKLKILILFAGLDIGNKHGGAEKFGVELVRCLQNMASDSVEVECCAFWQCSTTAEKYWIQVLQESGVNVFFANHWARKGYLPAYIKALKNFLNHYKDYHFQVVHSNFQLGTIAAILLKWFGGTKFVLRTAHITREWGDGIVNRTFRTVFSHFLFPIIIDAEIGVSDAMVDILRNCLGAKIGKPIIARIHNAINISDCQSEDITDSSGEYQTLPKNMKIIGSIGRLARQKNYPLLLKAYSNLTKKQEDTCLVIAGEGDLRPQLELEAESLGIKANTIFLGNCQNIPALLKQMQLFVLASDWEGLPTVVLESMAVGTPVIATNIPGTRELIDNGVDGWLVPPNNPEKLEECMLFALNHPQDTQIIIQNGLQKVKMYSFESVTKEYIKMYNHITQI